MNEVILKIGPAASGWAVDCNVLEPIFFSSGARAEAEGQKLAQRLSGAGHEVRLLVCDRTEQLIATRTYLGSLPQVP